MDPVTAEELQASFDSQETEELWLPDLSRVPWPALDYLGWIHPSGHLGYIALVSPNDGRLHGITMRRMRRRTRAVRLDMCSWCNHVHRMDGTAMFSVSVRGSNGRHRLGNVVCKDLDCSLRIRNMVTPESLMTEDIYTEKRVWRMQTALHRWLARARYL